MNFNTRLTASELSPRSPWRAFLEITLFSLIFCVLTAVVVAFPVGDIGLNIVWQRAVAAGSAAIEHIGITLGVYATTFLAFYGVVISAQLNRSRMAPQTQRFLSFTSELLFGCLTPAIVLIVLACAARPSLSGALFALLPAFTILFVVATVLGTFMVFSETERRESLEKALAKIAQNQEGLPRAGRWGAPTVLCYAAISALIGVLITGIFNGWVIQPAILVVLGSVHFVIAGGIGAGSAFIVISRQTAQGSFDKVSGTVITVIVFATVAFLLVSSLLSGLWTVAVSIAVTIVLIVVSMRIESENLRHVTIHGAATHISAQALSTQLKRVNRELTKLNEGA